MGRDDLAAKIHRPENDTGRIHMTCVPAEINDSLAYQIEKESRLRQFKIWQAESDAKREQMLKRLTLSDHQPMFNVNMYDCLSFCKKLNSFRNGHSFRLPTEAEWEYACRAGTEGPFAGNLDEMGWFCDNSNGSTHIVGQKMPNKWGLYDMHGNLAEWCADGWDFYTIPKYAWFIPR